MNFFSGDNVLLIGLLGSLLAGISTGAGALPVLFVKKVSHKFLDTMLGFAAGIMLAATSFSLIIPAIEYGGGGTRGVLITAIGVLMGGIFLDLVDRYSPHIHLGELGRKEGGSSNLKKVWLFVFAIAIHNFPEGLAVGVGYGTGDVSSGIILTIGIALQNIPEGLAVALSLLRENYSVKKAIIIAFLTGLVEFVGGILGIALVQVAKPVLPIALAFAGGAMLYVISDEIIPETHGRGFEKLATYGVLVGFVVMMVLDVVIG